MYKSEKNNKNVFETESGARRSNQPVGPSRSNNVSSLCKGQGTRSRCEESIWSKENSNKTRKTVSNHNDKLRGQPQLPHQMGFVPFAHYSISTSQYAQLQTSTYSFNRQFSGNLVPNMYFRRKENESASTSNTGPTTNEDRTWQNTTLGQKVLQNERGRPGVMFTLMNYNVLAQDLVTQHPQLYVNNAKHALKWQTRWKNLFKEISEHNCDILCFQEVQGSHLQDYYSKLESLGYRGLYKQRTGIRTDGCALYFKTNIFQLSEFHTVEYRQPNVSVLNRDNVAIIARLALQSNPEMELVVATTHLLYNPRRQDVRLAQTQVLLSEIERIAYKPVQFNNKNNYTPIIIAGDFNSTPKSPVYHLLTRGRVNFEDVFPNTNVYSNNRLLPSKLRITDNCQHADLLSYRETNFTLERADELKIIRLQHSEKREKHTDSENKNNHHASNGILTHNFNLKSVYNDSNEATTFQDEWVKVDYIFYSGRKEGRDIKDHKLILLAKYSLPNENKLQSLVIPNNYLGSDHLALVAKFKLEY